MTLEYLRASDGNGEAVRAIVTSIRTAGSTVINVDALTNWPTDFIATSGSLLSDGTLDPSSLLVFQGHISGSTIVIDTIAPGYTDAGNAVGQVVVVKPATEWADMLIDTLETNLNPAGTFKDTLSFTNLTANLLEGWIYDANTWTYVSGTGTTTGVFKIIGVDATGYLQAGMPFKLTQSGVTKYGFITKVAFSTDTTVTCFMAATANVVDNSGIANAAITSPAFAKPKQPGFGFPLDPMKWTVYADGGGALSGIASFGVWYNIPSSTNLSLGIGVWDVGYQGTIGQNNTTSGIIAPYCGLSTSSSGSPSLSETIQNYINRYPIANSEYVGVAARTTITLTAAGTLYMLLKADSGSGSVTAGFNNLRVWARIAYL